MPTLEAATPAKKTPNGIKGVIAGRVDLYMVPVNKIDIVPEFNARDFSTPENKAHVAWLADSIESEGIREPLRGYMGGDRFKVTNGECRLHAIKLLADRGVVIENVPVRLEERYSNDADRLYTQVTSNSGKGFTPLELSALFLRMCFLGQSEEDIAKRTATDIRRVKQLLDMQALPAKVKAMVADGTVSVSLAMETFATEGKDATKTYEVLTKAVENAKVAGRKVTKKFVGGEGGERKPSKTVQMKRDLAEICEILTAPVDLTSDEEDDLIIVSFSREQWDKLNSMVCA
jgi:hypothetical protein